MSSKKLQKDMPPFYLVISQIDSKEMYFPLIEYKDGSHKKLGTLPHLLDLQLLKTLKAIHFCLHLPRAYLDFASVDPVGFKHCQKLWLGQRILHIPSTEIEEHFQLLKDSSRHYSVILYEPSLKNDLDKFSELIKNSLLISFDEIRDELVQKVWQEVAKSYDKFSHYDYSNEKFLLKEMDNNFGLKITTSFILKHLGKRSAEHLDKVTQEYICSLHRFIRQHQLVQLHQGHPDKYADESWQSFEIPITLIVPGIAKKYLKLMDVNEEVFLKNEYNNIDNIDKMTPFGQEDVCLKLIGAHEAISHNGCLVYTDPLDFGAFQALDQIETHCQQANFFDGSFIWKKIKTISEILAKVVKWDEGNLILRASYIQAYTKFPVGLMIFDGYTSPLSCIKPIVYRPIMPLTRTFQQHFSVMKESSVLGPKIIILFAEMIDGKEEVGKICRLASKFVRDSFKNNEMILIEIEEFNSMNDLNIYLEKNHIDILVIGAHGHYDKKKNSAGIICGGFFSLGLELVNVPKIVILRSCGTSPMGISSVNIVDMLLRNGCQTVIASSIPIDARKNAHLVVRLFNYILDEKSMLGEKATFLDAWFRVTSTNAVLDIMMSNEKLLTQKDNYVQDFMRRSGEFNIVTRDVYKDTLNALLQISEGEPIHELLQSLKDKNEVIPETCFYQIFGWPDRIFLEELLK